jgi:serine/threonine protein kinase
MSRPTEDRIARRAGATPSGVTSVVTSRHDDDQRIGTVVDGRYRLDALVGRGGMGVVYRAEHVAIRRTVALKLLHSSLAGIPELRSRFEREAAAIGRIEHPNCVNVSDFGSLEDGSLFLVMEYLEGRSLGEVLEREHHLRPRRALRILRHVLTGLGHAHQSGIVHRDIKPDNVVLTTQGNDEVAKILDFGIAKMIGETRDEDVKLTQAGVAFGTPVYMSPEQALGNPVDGRADLYAASVMAFEMLTGRPPFFSDDKLEVMSMHTTREVPEMGLTLIDAGYPGAEIPPPVEELIVRGLAKRPHERWANADAYIAALDEVMLDLALAAPDAEATPPPELEPRTHTGHTGATPLLTSTGSSLIGKPKPGHTAPAYPADPLQSMPVELLRKKREATARPFWKQPLAIFSAGAVVAVAAAFAIVIGMSGGEPADKPRGSTAAARAQQELDRGNPAAAIKGLEAQKDKIARDPSAQLQLGHAYAAKRDNQPAVEAYRRAIALDPKTADDADLRANLRAITGDKDVAAAMQAFELLIGPVHDFTAKDLLIAMASGKDAGKRAGAVRLVQRLGLDAKVDWRTSYELDLDQGELCQDRKEAVAKLRALGDARAIPALEKAVARKVKKKASKLSNACLVDEAGAALTYLRSLPGAPATEAHAP